MARYTISTHNGSKVSQRHNRRDRKITDKEKHINPKGSYEVWKDEDEKEAYHRLFDASLKEYNDKQKRADRRIEDYHKHIENDSKKHTCYEMIIQIGNIDNHPDTDTCMAIYRRFFEGWKDRNPNLELIGAYYHADEVESMTDSSKNCGGHLHIDYIPYYHSDKRGLSVQTGLEKALNEQGFTSDSIKATAQMKWQKRENEALEGICNRYGLEIEHPRIEGVKHQETKAYKQQQRIDFLKEQSDKWEELVNMEMQNSEYWDKKAKEAKAKYEALKNQVDSITIKAKELESIKAEVDYWEHMRDYAQEGTLESLNRWDELRQKYIDDIEDLKKLKELEEENSEKDELFLYSIKLKDKDSGIEMDL